MGSPTLPKVNTKWFRARLTERNLSQRGLAKLMDMDPAGVSLMLRGKRHVYPDEIAKLADLLRQPVDIVLEQLGSAAPKTNRPGPPVAGRVNQHGEVYEGRVAGPRTAPAAEGAPEGTVALRIEAPALPQDGWLLYYTPTAGVASDIVGALCVVKIQGDKTPTVGYIQKSYHPGKVLFIPFLPGKDREAILESAARVRLVYMA